MKNIYILYICCKNKIGKTIKLKTNINVKFTILTEFKNNK